MEKKENLKRNQNGDTPSDKPSKKLIHPPKKTGIVKEHRSNFNITGKDYKLGDRNTFQSGAQRFQRVARIQFSGCIIN